METVEDMAKVHTTGRVEPARQVIVVPEVGDVWFLCPMNWCLEDVSKEGEEIGRIDPANTVWVFVRKNAGHSGRVRTGTGNPKRRQHQEWYW